MNNKILKHAKATVIVWSGERNDQCDTDGV